MPLKKTSQHIKNKEIHVYLCVEKWLKCILIMWRTKTDIQTNKDEGFLENAEMLAETDKIVTEEKELSMTTT